jgi:peptide/nickel transport system permease protein
MLAGLSMPTFLVGLLLIYFLFFRLHLAGITWFPPGGYVPLAQDPVGWARTCCCPGSPWPP